MGRDVEGSGCSLNEVPLGICTEELLKITDRQTDMARIVYVMAENDNRHSSHISRYNSIRQRNV